MEDDTSWHTSSSDDELGGERSTPFIIPSTTTTLTHSNGSSSSSIGGSGSGVGAPPPHLSTSSRSGQQHYELDDDDDDDDDHHDDPHRDLDDGLGTIAVRGVPVWIADHERKACILCGTPFGFFVRRHHCRRCGEIVCAECSGHTAILLEMLPPIVVQCMRRAMALESGDHAARRPFDLASSLPSHVGEVLIAVDLHGVSYMNPMRFCDRCHQERENPPPPVGAFSNSTRVPMPRHECVCVRLTDTALRADLLHTAITIGSLEQVQAILRKGDTDLDARDPQGLAPLHRLLLSSISARKMRADSFADVHRSLVCESGDNVIDVAAVGGANAGSSSHLSFPDLSGFIALYDANGTPIRSSLTESDGDHSSGSANHRHQHGSRGTIPKFDDEADTLVRCEIARALIAADAQVDIRDPNERTPLHYAVHIRSAPFGKVLLANGADPDTQDDQGRAPLHYVTGMCSIRRASCMYLRTSTSKMTLAHAHTQVTSMETSFDYYYKHERAPTSSITMVYIG